MRRIEMEKAEIIHKYGKWTAYDIKLKDGIYTKDEREANSALKKLLDDSRYHTM